MSNNNFTKIDKEHRFGSIADLKESLNSWLDHTIYLDGEKKTTSQETADGKLIMKIEDAFISHSEGDGSKKTYVMVIDRIKEEGEGTC